MIPTAESHRQSTYGCQPVAGCFPGQETDLPIAGETFIKHFFLKLLTFTRQPNTVTSEPADDIEQEDRLRARRLLAITAMTPANTIGSILNLLLTMLVTDGLVNRWLAAIWVISTGLLMLMAVLSWLRILQRPSLPERTPARVERRAVAHAALLALCWSLPSLSLFNIAAPEQQLFIATITAGMICAGGFTLYTLPRAALTFVGILGTGSAITLLLSDLESAKYLLMLLLVYLSILMISIVHASESFKAQVIAEIVSEQQKQVISLLLNDFEQSTADVLWETDQQLTLRRSTVRMSETLGDPAADFSGQNLLELILQSQRQLPDEMQELAQRHFDELQQRLQDGKPFRDLEIPLWVNRQQTWWTLTAKPVEAGWRGVISDITQTQQARQQVWRLAHEDTVTGLANRRHFQNELGLALKKTERQKGLLKALLFIDLDRFKAVNDTFGHDAGDRLLAIIAERLKTNIRPKDLVARMGGDEFAVLLRKLDSEQQALEIADRLISSLQQPCDLGNATASVGASIGIAFIPTDGLRTETLMKHADLALYRAKGNGRGQAVTFQRQMAENARTSSRIEQALANALRGGRINLAYQPQCNLDGGQIIGLEVLARWTDDELGSIPPTRFIKIAEETGMIHELGKQVLQQACLQARLWSADITMAVNISPIQLASPGIVDEIADVLRSYRIDPSRIELEITETALLDDSFSIQDKLMQLKELGVRISLDDFGTGYSSLAYLRNLPFDKIKIDQSFVQQICSDPKAEIMVKTVIDMANALKIQVVAEGIEDQPTLDRLRQMGCDTGQGFHLFMPMTPEQFGSLLVHKQA